MLTVGCMLAVWGILQTFSTRFFPNKQLPFFPSWLVNGPTFSAHGDSHAITSPFMDAGDIHPSLPIFRAIAQRNSDRARRRYLRACGNVLGNGDVTLEDGRILPEPSDDGPIPMEPDATYLTLPPPFNTF